MLKHCMPDNLARGHLSLLRPRPPTHTRMTRSYNININQNALFFYGTVIRHYTLHTFASTTQTTISTLYSGISQFKNSQPFRVVRGCLRLHTG